MLLNENLLSPKEYQMKIKEIQIKTKEINDTNNMLNRVIEATTSICFEKCIEKKFLEESKLSIYENMCLKNCLHKGKYAFDNVLYSNDIDLNRFK